MSGTALAAAAAAVLLAAAVQSASGFGFALVAGPALVALLEPAEAVSALTLLGLLVNGLVLAGDRTRPSRARRPDAAGGHAPGGAAPGEAARLLAWALPGLALGAALLARLPADVLRVAVGLVVLAALGLGDGGRLRRPWRPPAWAAGLAAGALTTTTGVNGPPLVLRLLAVGLPAPARRRTLALLFLALGLLATVALAAGGQLRPPAATLPLAVAVAIGALLGARVARRLDPALEARAARALLAASALAALASGLA